MARALTGQFSELIDSVLSHFLAVDRAGARRRVGLVLLLFTAYWLVIILLECAPDSRCLPELSPALNDPDSILALAQWAALTVLAPSVLRHLIPALLGFMLAVEAGARYLDDLFELESVPTAQEYLYSAVFGQMYSRMEIRDGEILEEHRERPIVKIGGPGYVKVHLSNAAVFEQVDGKVKVYGPTEGEFIAGFERLREVVDLRDQVGVRDEVKALSKDGIEVTGRDIKMVFRVRGDSGRSPAAPYPYTDMVVRQLVYGKTVGQEGQEGKGAWIGSLPGKVSGIVGGYIMGKTLDELLENGGANPRQNLTAQFYLPGMQDELFNMGLELVWVGVGTWVTPDKVSQERIETWQKQWLDECHSQPKSLDRLQQKSQVAAEQEIIASINRWWFKHAANPDSLYLDIDLIGTLITVFKGIQSDPDVARGLPADYETAVHYLERQSGKNAGEW